MRKQKAVPNQSYKMKIIIENLYLVFNIHQVSLLLKTMNYRDIEASAQLSTDKFSLLSN